MCNLKSSNLESLISSAPCPGLTSFPSSTVHAPSGLGLSILHPVRSFPLNNWIALPHFGALVLCRVGALRPVHCHGVPSCPVVVPERVLPTSLPTKTMSSFRSSSSFGETNVRLPFEISILGSGRAFPQRLTICARNCPSSCWISNHEGYSRSGAFSVRSHRPKKALTDAAPFEEAVFSEYAPDKKTEVSITTTKIALRSFIELKGLLFSLRFNSVISDLPIESSRHDTPQNRIPTHGLVRVIGRVVRCLTLGVRVSLKLKVNWCFFVYHPPASLLCKRSICIPRPLLAYPECRVKFIQMTSHILCRARSPASVVFVGLDKIHQSGNVFLRSAPN